MPRSAGTVCAYDQNQLGGTQEPGDVRQRGLASDASQDGEKNRLELSEAEERSRSSSKREKGKRR